MEERQYGIPVAVMRLQERVFESLPASEQPAFALDCAKAIGVDGKNLSLVIPQMTVALLSRLPKKDEIAAVINLFERVIDGEDIECMRPEFEKAADAAHGAGAISAASAVFAAFDAFSDADVADAVSAAFVAGTKLENQLQKTDLLRFLENA